MRISHMMIRLTSVLYCWGSAGPGLISHGMTTPAPRGRTTVVQRRVSKLTLLSADDS